MQPALLPEPYLCAALYKALVCLMARRPSLHHAIPHIKPAQYCARRLLRWNPGRYVPLQSDPFFSVLTTNLSGFYQDGAVSWKTFFHWLLLLLDTSDPWMIVRGDRVSSPQCFPSDAIVPPGKYMLLRLGMRPLQLRFTSKADRRL